MRRVTHNEAGDTDLVFVLGWGIRLDFENVRWLVDRLAAADYRVHVFELPLVITDFEREYLAPVANFVSSLSNYRLLTHSTGGLVGAFLDGPETRVDLSPWWGTHKAVRTPLVSPFLRLPVTKPLVPVGIDRSDLGDLATDFQVEDTPERIAPTVLRECRRVQQQLPPFDEDSVVFYTPDDTVVSVDAIRERAPEENCITYEGGHELFSSSARDELLPTLLAAIDHGVRAVP
ncbi:alpha/beta hydrolase [Haloarculaceae archaeon H-GB11]|nr:alpha/beta hydrolase [Haloarculaceae archaeon H-GB11]